jgi:hypothetical protein
VVAGDGSLVAVSLADGSVAALTSFSNTATAAVFDADGRVAFAVGIVQSRLFVSEPPYVSRVELSGVPDDVIDAIAFRNGRLLAGTRAGGVYVQTSADLSLTAATTAPTGGGVTALLTADSGPVYAAIGGEAGGLFKSDDSGLTFAAVGANTGTTGLSGACIEPASGVLGLVGASTMYTSSDQGGTWQTLPPPPSIVASPGFRALALSCTLATDAGTTRFWLPTLERGTWLTKLP